MTWWLTLMLFWGSFFFSVCVCVHISIGEGNGTLLQYSCLKNPVDGEAWWATVHGVVKSRTRLSDFTFTFYFHALEKEMATHSSVLAWRIPGTGEPGGLPSMGPHRVRHDWSNLEAAAAAYIYYRFWFVFTMRLIYSHVCIYIYVLFKVANMLISNAF